MQKRIKGEEGIKWVQLFVPLVLVLFMAQIFVPLAVTNAQLELECNETAVDGNGNLTSLVNNTSESENTTAKAMVGDLGENTSENTTVKAMDEDPGNKITFVLGTDENWDSLNNASASATVAVETYNASQAKSKDFSTESVVFLASLDNETVVSINQTMNGSAHVFAYNLSSNISIGNVEDVNITKYWVYGGDENIEDLIIYMDNRFYGNMTAVDPPKPPEDRVKISFVIDALTFVYNNVKKAMEDPYISKSINATAYRTSIEDPASYDLDLNLSDRKVIMIYHVAYPVQDGLKDTVEAAKANGAYIITAGVQDVHNLGNVNLSDPEYEDIMKYYEYSVFASDIGEENMKRLLAFFGVKFCNLSMEVLPPLPIPTYGVYHPDAPKVFDETSEYMEWYNATGRYNASNLTVGIQYTALPPKYGITLIYDTLIRSLESKGANVIHATYSYKDPNSSRYFIQDNKSIVDALILSTSHSRLHYKNPEKGLEYLRNLNVTPLQLVKGFYMSAEDWENSTHGLNPKEVAYHLAIPELDGLTEFIYVAGKTMDPISGLKYYKPVDYQIDWLADRAISWANLHRMNNFEKNIAITYYSEGGGKGSVGAAIDYYHDAPSSLAKMLDAMKERGYDVGTEPLPDKTELAEMMRNESNVGTWARDILNERVENGSMILIPESTYLEWFESIPVDKQNEMTERWGPAPGEIMVYENETGKYLVIPKVQFGNVLLLPHPTWGFAQNETVMYYEGAVPPHHQYLAFYYWLNKEFRADALFTVFPSLAVMPGKQVTSSRYDWTGLLLQDMPHIHPFPIQGGNAGLTKRKTNAVIIDYMPTIVPSGLYWNLSNLQRTISLYETVEEGDVKEGYRNEITGECINLSLDHDLEIDINTTVNNATAFDSFVKRLDAYLDEIKAEYMPYGSHTLSEPPTNESLVELVEAMLGDEFKEHVSAINDSEGVTTELLTEVLLNGLTPFAAQDTVLGQLSDNVTEDLNLSMEYANRIAGCKIEIPRILDAFEGKYIPPGPMDDPIRNPDALPTGRNPYAFDPREIPTEAAWNAGVNVAEQLLAEHLNKTGEYPRKVAFVLWASETLLHQGVMESEMLYLLGVKLKRDSKMRVTGVELINSSDLGRPRIDVVVVTSGTYRDVFEGNIHLIDQAVRLADQADDTEYPNYVNESSESIYQALIDAGYNESMAQLLKAARIFSEAPGAYATGLQYAIPASHTWEDRSELAELYINRGGNVYGEDIWGMHSPDLFKQNLNGVEVAVFSRSSNVCGVLDHAEVANYFGGLSLAIESVTGNAPDMYINNLRAMNNPRVETLRHFLNRELRARYFNPKWIEGMMEHGYDGARYMDQFTADMWAWDAVNPDLITGDMWNQVYDTYVQDIHNLGMQKFFDDNNPYALQDITATMLEAIRKEYWTPSDEVKTMLAETYQQSVEKFGPCCCMVCCGNLLLDTYVQGIISAAQPPEEQQQQQQQQSYHRGGGGPSTKREELSAEGVTNQTIDSGVGITGEAIEKPPAETGETAEEVKKGKVMKEEKTAPAPPISGAPLMGLIAVLVIMVFVGMGFWIKRRR